MPDPAPFIPRPAAAFRVGISGARALTQDADQLKTLRAQLDDVLAEVKSQVELHATSARAAGVYAPGAPLLRMLSPLAEGADRLAALAATDLGYQLYVPMPFKQDDYETDFKGSVDEFHALLAKAGPRVLELDGGRGAANPASYEAVGQLVTSNCDLLIAIWDGGPGKGRGGTADIVRFAAERGVPVWWLRPDGSGEPAWIASPLQLRQPENCPRGGDADLKLRDLLRNAILPPAETKQSEDADKRLRDFFAETALPDGAPWRSFQTVMSWTAGPPPLDWPWKIYQKVLRPGEVRAPKLPPPVPAGDVWQYWRAIYEPVNRFAVDYGNRYRSSYIMVFGLAALVLLAASFGLHTGREAVFFNTCELSFLLIISLIVYANANRRWHERLITYRLLAELFRKQQVLALLGWSLLQPDAAHISGDTEELDKAAPRDVWVGWFFNAAVRAAPLPQGSLAGQALTEIFRAVLGGLVAGQADYHANRWWDSKESARRFGQWGRWFFVATVVLVSVKFGFLVDQHFRPMFGADDSEDIITVMRILLAILPGLSAAFVGIRGYAELELLAAQSAQLHRDMKQAETLLDAKNFDLNAPLASQYLGTVVAALAKNMLADVKGWAQLFRVKVLETG